jgi:hypothetical protein
MASADQRPMSVYDNLSGENNNSKRIPFSEIQFKFDDDISRVNAQRAAENGLESGQKGEQDSDNVVNSDDITDDSQKLVENGEKAEIVKHNEEHKRSISIALPEAGGPSQVNLKK